ncbi:MAG: secretin N-terminal domain-containing protein [Aliarcobacter sp.]|nr:secretin N-terminal domain-containing protein [Aliarcobacter sp.]
MKLNRVLFVIILVFNLFANDEINVNFKDLRIVDLIKITSKIINKNILITQEIEGTVDFIPNKPLTKNELVKILYMTLEDKGYTLVEEHNILRVVKLLEAKKETSIIKLKNIKADFAKKSLDEISKSIFNQDIKKENISIIENIFDNSITFIAEKKDIEYLIKYIKDIDDNSISLKKEVKVINLKNIDASNILKILEDIVSKKENPDSVNKPIISLDVESNSIVVMGNSEEIAYINRLIQELDVEKAQVYVQARIIEVNDELVNKIGISYGIFAGNANNNGLTAFSSSLNGGSDSISLLKDAIGIDIPDIKSGLALGASLNLLKQNGALDIVSEPSILAINNKESSIYVGETISIKTSSSVTDGGTTRENFQREDVGLTLKVKPRISNETKVTLEINTILEGVKTTQTVSGNADTSKKEVKTTAILNNGESVIIGGLIENKIETTNQKVPILGDIPLFGELFKNDISNNKKNNLVVIVTPYMIPKTKDITFIRNKLSQLKNLEDKYLEDSLIKLKENHLKRKIQDKNREEKSNELDKEIEKVSSNYEKNEHEKRVHEVLGN